MNCSTLKLLSVYLKKLYHLASWVASIEEGNCEGPRNFWDEREKNGEDISEGQMNQKIVHS